MKKTNFEVNAYLDNCKIFLENAEKSKLVQKKLFDCGYHWTEFSKEYLFHFQSLYILLYHNMIYNFSDKISFDKGKYREISANAVLKFDIVETIFNKNDKVVRKNSNDGSYGIVLKYSIPTSKYCIKFGNTYEMLYEYELDFFKLYDFKHLDKVLVRDEDSQNWTCGIFLCFDAQNYPNVYVVSGCSQPQYKQCIPYNEYSNLLGTSDKPVKEDLYRKWGYDPFPC